MATEKDIIMMKGTITRTVKMGPHTEMEGLEENGVSFSWEPSYGDWGSYYYFSNDPTAGSNGWVFVEYGGDI